MTIGLLSEAKWEPGGVDFTTGFSKVLKWLSETAANPSRNAE
jgi:hypothetical protein